MLVPQSKGQRWGFPPGWPHFCFLSLDEMRREFVVQLLAHTGHDLSVAARIVAQCARHVLIRHVLPFPLKASPHLGKLVLLGRVEAEEALRFVDPV